MVAYTQLEIEYGKPEILSVLFFYFVHGLDLYLYLLLWLFLILTINEFTNANYIYHHHHHHVVQISLILSRHFSLSFIASGRSSGLHPVSTHSCCMYVRAGRPAFARPYVGVHWRTSLMCSSLLLQQCPACLVRLTGIVFVMGSGWPYSWCFVGCCLQENKRKRLRADKEKKQKVPRKNNYRRRWHSDSGKYTQPSWNTTT